MRTSLKQRAAALAVAGAMTFSAATALAARPDADSLPRGQQLQQELDRQFQAEVDRKMQQLERNLGQEVHVDWETDRGNLPGRRVMTGTGTVGTGETQIDVSIRCEASYLNNLKK
jgi:hypothetical protein